MPKEPDKKFNLGNIYVSIWENQSDKGKPWFNVAVTRSYHDGDGYKITTTYRHNDLPVVSKAMDFAYGWIWKRQIALEKKAKGDA